MKITHKDFIGIYENVLPKSDCDKIISEIEKNIQNGNPVVNSKIEIHKGNEQFNRNRLLREDYSFFPHIVGPGFIVDLVNNALKKCLDIYSTEFFVFKNLNRIRSDEIKLQKTPPKGGYHVWHCEQSSLSMASRVLVWTIYLNDVPDGEGETEFLWQGVRIKPKAGTVCIFPAAFTHTHRGNPVYSHNKYIATGWVTLIE